MKSYNHTQIQEALDKIQESQLSSPVVDASQDRVWSKINSSIQNNTAMSKPSPSTQTNSWRNMFFKPRAYLIGGSIFLMVVVVAVAIQFSLNKPQPTDPTQAIPISELREKADRRLAQLTNGVSLTTLQATVDDLEVPQSAQAEAGSNAPSRDASQTSTLSIVNAKEAQEIVQQQEITDGVVFYTETELTYESFENEYCGGGPTLSGLIYCGGFPTAEGQSQTVNLKSWTSANYYKTITTQEGKIIDFYLSTPEYSLSYMGGKYAIKEIYAEANYFSGISLIEGDSPRNYEIDFLKYLLDPSNDFEDLGMQEVDRRYYRVIEANFEDFFEPVDCADPLNYAGCGVASESSQDETQGTIDDLAMNNFTTRYYIDQDNLILYLTEELQDGQVISSSKNLASETYQNQPLANFFHAQEVAGVELKEITITYPTQEDLSLSNFIKKFDLYYSPKLSMDFIYAYDESIFQKGGFELYNSPDYNPYLIDMEENSPQWVPILASYYQDAIRVIITEQEPNQDDYYGELVENKTIQVSLEGQVVNGQFLERRETYPEEKLENGEVIPAATYTTKIVTFQVNGYWYQLSVYDSSFMDQPAPDIFADDKLELTKLTADQAREIDDRMAQMPGTVETMPIENLRLEEIPEDLRYLPGDLQPEFNLTPIFLSINTDTETVCDSSTKETFYLECLQDSNRSFVLTYENPETLTQFPEYFSFTLTDVDPAKVDLKSFDQYLPSQSVKEVEELPNGIKILQDKENSNLIVLQEWEGKTLLINSNLPRENVLQIINGAEVSKDLKTLQAQLDQGVPDTYPAPINR